MNAAALKRAVWWAALLLGGATLLLAFPVLGSVYTRAERARLQVSALNLLGLRTAAPGVLSWAADDPASPRAMEPYTRDALTSSYQRGYEELSYALASGDSSGLGSYYQEGALADARLVASSGPQNVFIDWDHRLRLHFYAPDGGTAAFSDTYSYAEGAATRLQSGELRLARRTVDVVMALDDGNWRVNHWRVTDDASLLSPVLPRPALAARLRQVRGVNYQPRSAPFAAFWLAPDAREVQRDFARVRALGLNTVRVFVPFPLPPNAPATLTRLLDAAHAQHLQVIPTLLDGYTRYSVSDLPDIFRMLHTLRAALRRPEVLLIDVKNEPDQDAGKVGWPQLRFFLGGVVGAVRQLTGQPVTAGTITADASLSQTLDVVSVHSYAPAGVLRDRLRAASAGGRPVLLEEFGFHTLGRHLPDPHTEAEQAWYDAQVVAQARQQRLGWLTWTLYDLPTGAVPGGAATERSLGILRADGSPKPAVQALRGAAVTPPSLPGRLQKWLFVWPLPLTVLTLALVWAWRRRRREQRTP